MKKVNGSSAHRVTGPGRWGKTAQERLGAGRGLAGSALSRRPTAQQEAQAAGMDLAYPREASGRAGESGARGHGAVFWEGRSLAGITWVMGRCPRVSARG